MERKSCNVYQWTEELNICRNDIYGVWTEELLWSTECKSYAVRDRYIWPGIVSAKAKLLLFKKLPLRCLNIDKILLVWLFFCPTSVCHTFFVHFQISFICDKAQMGDKHAPGTLHSSYYRKSFCTTYKLVEHNSSNPMLHCSKMMYAI